MGWKTLFVADENFFKTLIENSIKWGDLIPYELVVNNSKTLASGLVSSQPTQPTSSLSIAIPSIFRTLITVEYGFYASKGSSGKASLFIYFTKGDVVIKDPYDREMFGVLESTVNAGTDMIEKHTLYVEHMSGSVRWWVDNSQPAVTTLTSIPDSLKIACKVDEVSSGEVGILITRSTVMVYDVIEDLYSVFIPFTTVMTFITFVTLLSRRVKNI